MGRNKRRGKKKSERRVTDKYYRKERGWKQQKRWRGEAE